MVRTMADCHVKVWLTGYVMEEKQGRRRDTGKHIEMG